MSNVKFTGPCLAVAAFFAFATAAFAQHDMPAGMTHEQHQAQMKKEAEMKQRGNAAMGFDQDKTTHHFPLRPDGGAVQVTTNDTADTASRDAIRAHLKEISEQFAKGDFSAPFATHNETIPGVATMQKLKPKLTYGYEELPQGAAVTIRSADKKAIAAVHDFLRYQIKEHATGDPMEVPR
jgi:hypothetical protein